MNNKNFRLYLKQQSACSEGVRWVGDKTLAQAWNAFDRSDWMFWLIQKSGKIPQGQLVLVACACAYSSLPNYEKQCPGDDRPRKAIEAAERWAKHPTVENKAAARSAVESAEAAAKAYDVRATELFGSFARLNFAH
jgi:hypothetical protein